jgi:tetratricopeptide (TPR) repeat protein/energy-coupling factor transporter ATP-binding protein EcfA2
MTAAAGTYVSRREEEAEILRQVQNVRTSGRSRAVLLNGPGGAGKTTLVRHLASRADPAGDGVVWVRPIDVDDSQYWLMSNLETEVATQLGRVHFHRYFGRLQGIGQVAHQQVSYETVLARLSRINRTFVDCYREFVQERDVTVVITLDTIEAIRSMYLLLTLTQWMKQLPHTLFILSGRPPAHDEPDPLREELSDRHRSLQPVELRMRGFTEDEARHFLDETAPHESLSAPEQDRLIDLTDRQPLWLALAVEYLRVDDVPPEMTPAHRRSDADRDNFRRRLVTLYRSTDFWPEAIKRLAVVRHSVTQDVWTELMSDKGLPPDADSWDDAWRLLLARPWVRPRANARYVTLHDALAQELAQRLIPMHDRDGAWRRGLWRHAKQIYADLTEERGQQLDAALTRVGAALQAADEGAEELVAEVSRVDAEKRELDQLLAAQLHYEILDDFTAGTNRFLELCDQATRRRDPLFMELICHEMEVFLPRGDVGRPPQEILDLRVAQYRRWIVTEAPERHVAVAVRIAGFLIRSEQPESALELLDNLPDVALDPELLYRLAIERGNASMRISGRVAQAHGHILGALEYARLLGRADERALREAEAHKELGWHYRNLGYWVEADAAYRTARDVLARMMGPGSPVAFRREMASIQTNWAYLKALRGSFREARNLIDTAVAVRRKLSSGHLVGASLSVSGEVYRYEANFGRAWAIYQEAEVVFQETKSWPWLGTLYQQMAICLHQATRDGSTLVDNQAEVTVALAEQALDICHESNVRAYPSALNRAGRIFFTAGRVDEGLENLRQGIVEAERLGDGWFRSANNIEYVEYAYRAWLSTDEQRYRNLIDERTPAVTAVIGEYGFRDIAARWELLRGHLLANDGIAAVGNGGMNEVLLDAAVGQYSLGFRMLADESVGSHGSAAIAREFTRFRGIFDQLPLAVQDRWYKKLSVDWTAGEPNEQSISLLARLEELY